MRRMLSMVVTAVALVALVPLGGCGDANQDRPGTSAVGEPGAGGAMPKATTEQAEIQAALARLSPEDRTLAEKQKVCPVSGELLGSMGVPERVEVDGRPVLICCDGCLEAIREHPDEYLKAIDKTP